MYVYSKNETILNSDFELNEEKQINTKIKLITGNLISLHSNLNKLLEELQPILTNIYEPVSDINGILFHSINCDIINLYLYTLQAMTGMVKSILDNLMIEKIDYDI